MVTSDVNLVLAAALAGVFTWAMTAIGAASVFLSKRPTKKFLDISLGFAAGVMIAASFWSLLAPALEMGADKGRLAIVPVALGFVCGGAFLRLIDNFVPHLHVSSQHPEGVSSTWRKSMLLVMAITLHNIPEGLAVGVGFGAVGSDISHGGSMGAAISLALGIGIQNLPEGLAVALPLRREGLSAFQAFFWGQLSGLVEPVSAILGASLVYIAKPVLPFFLAFAAGAMIFVVVEDVIPESQSSGNADVATMGVIGGFTLMMILDVVLA